MPITWAMKERWIEIAFTDPYTLAESEAVMKEIFREPALTRPFRFLVDVRQSTPPNTEFVGNAITFWQLHIDKMWGAKIAVVTGTERQARVADISEQLAVSRELPFTMHVFDESDEAQAQRWLGEPVPPSTS